MMNESGLIFFPVPADHLKGDGTGGGQCTVAQAYTAGGYSLIAYPTQSIRSSGDACMTLRGRLSASAFSATRHLPRRRVREGGGCLL